MTGLSKQLSSKMNLASLIGHKPYQAGIHVLLVLLFTVFLQSVCSAHKDVLGDNQHLSRELYRNKIIGSVQFTLIGKPPLSCHQFDSHACKEGA